MALEKHMDSMKTEKYIPIDVLLAVGGSTFPYSVLAWFQLGSYPSWLHFNRVSELVHKIVAHVKMWRLPS